MDVCVCVCSAGHTVYYCGRYSRWAAIRTRRFPSKSCSTCYATDIAWTDQRMLHTKCAYLRTHILRSRGHQFSLPRLSTVLYLSYVRQSMFVSVYLVLSFLLIVVFFSSSLCSFRCDWLDRNRCSLAVLDPRVGTPWSDILSPGIC